MSRVGKEPIKIPAGVKVHISESEVKLEGSNGKLMFPLPPHVKVKQEGDLLTVERDSDEKEARSMHGMSRSIISNMVHGVSTGFTRELDITGVGYRAAVKGDILNLTLGFSHPIDYKLPVGVSAKVDKNTHLILTGADKETLGLVAAQIRGFRPPEPYQGKGVRYSDERIVRKQGKSAGAK